MKKLLICTTCLLALGSAAAMARPMTKMEYMDPKSIGIWQSLSDQEKLDSVVAQINDSQEPLRSMSVKEFALTEAEISDVAQKAKACIQKEVDEPDLKGEEFPLYHISQFCMQKYTSIVQAHKMDQRMSEVRKQVSESMAKKDAAEPNKGSQNKEPPKP